MTDVIRCHEYIGRGRGAHDHGALRGPRGMRRGVVSTNSIVLELDRGLNGSSVRAAFICNSDEEIKIGNSKGTAPLVVNRSIGNGDFEDTNSVMNLSILDKKGEILVISQFTLQASTKKGNRPSYVKAAKPEVAIPLYNSFVDQLDQDLGTKVQTGEFGADMKIHLINDGPVTIMIDSKNKT